MRDKSFLIALIFALTSFAVTQGGKPPATGNYEISGKLVNGANGETIHKVHVIIAPVTERGQTQQLDIASDGAFVFHNLAAGKYSLSALARGFAMQAFEQHEGFSTAIAVGPNKASTGIVFRMRPESSISGQLLDEHNEALRDAQVILFVRNTDVGKRVVQRRGQTQTDDLGEYHFRHLPPGTYYVAVSAQPWFQRGLQRGSRIRGGTQPTATTDPALDVAYPVTYYPSVTDPENAGALVLRAGDSVTADVSLIPVPSMHLLIRNTGVDAGRNIQPNFRERVFGETSVFVQPTMTWGEGQVEVSGIAPGEYALDLIRNDGRFDGNNRRGRRGQDHLQRLNLQSNAEIDALNPASLESVHGQVKFDGAHPPGNAVIQLRDASSGELLGDRIDDQGAFTIQPQHSGRYIVSLGNAPGYAIRTISAGSGHVSGRAIDFNEGQPLELAITASEGVGTVKGTVIKGDQPVSGTMVVLVPQDIADNTSLFRRDQSDSDGTFTLRDVVPGRYTAIGIQNGWDLEWASAEALRPYLGAGTPVQVDGKQQLDIKIAPQ